MEWNKMWIRQPSLLQIMLYQRKLKNVKFFNRLVCLVHNLHVKLNLGFSCKTGFNKRKALFTCKFAYKLKE